ncbi:MAG TPA: hypothetical protein HPP80_07690 [Rhodospirillaceae bacterium]|nr:hypothetical protein [Rhodospirillaceae bacterium]
MDHRNPKKIFSAELQRLKSKGELPSKAAMDDPAGVLLAINGLRDDIRSLENLVRQGVPQTDEAPDAELVEFDRKRAEVNQLKTEIRALSLAISHTKSEIAALRPPDAKDDRLVAVANELDAIVAATEGATQTILEGAEKVDGLAQQLQAQAGDSFTSRVAEDLRDVVVSMFEACNFQDITGQRITKVVRTLQFVEDRVNRMIEIWGADSFQDMAKETSSDRDDEKDLLNGPALENQGVSQADIDKLFD